MRNIIRLRICLVFCLAIVLGCDEPTDSTGNDNPGDGSGKLRLTTTKPIELKGGVRWARGIDTMVSYDMSEPIAFKNTSGSTIDVSVFGQLGALIDGEFTSHPDFLSWEDNTLPMIRIDTTLGPGEIVILYKDLLSLGRSMPLDWRFPYAYRVSYWSGGDTTVIVDTFAGCVESNRYKGYLRTSGSSTSLGVVDGPDDNDWASTDSTRLVAQCGYSNPVTDPPALRVNFTLSQDMDSIHMSIHETDNFAPWVLKEGKYKKGMWVVNPSPTLRKRGLHRFMLRAFRNGEVFSVKGDVMVE